MKTGIRILSIICTLTACTKSTENKPAVPDLDANSTLYISGYSYDPLKDQSIAIYWKDTTEFFVSDTNASQHAFAYSIFFNGGDLYLGGWSYAPPIAQYWVNKNSISLNPDEIDIVKSIAVSGKDVYVAGLGPNANHERGFAKYNKNGITVSLGNEKDVSSADAVAISGNDVYVAWNEINPNFPGVGNYQARIAKNGISTVLSDSGSTGYASAICVSGNDVYVAGYTERPAAIERAVYWKNGVLINLTADPNSSYANGIVVSDQDVYICGATSVNGGSTATYWKNGKVVTLTDPSIYSFATGIGVIGNDVYVSGVSNQKPVYWRNGNIRNLPDAAPSCTTSGIFVVKK
jgi:hypothetical protein